MKKFQHHVVTVSLIFILIFALTGCNGGGGTTPPITPNTYTITASAGSHGSISPSGNVTVNQGLNKSFAITPDAGYIINDILVDGNSVGAVSSYTFTNVTQDHTISATFISKFYYCMYTNYPPFTYIDNNDNPVGFDIDCVNWIAKEMGFEVDYSYVPWYDYWAVVVTSFAAGATDFAVSGLRITEWSEGEVDFTIPYWQIDQEEPYGYAVSKEEQELKEMLNEGLRRLMNSPKWNEFVAKWELQE